MTLPFAPWLLAVVVLASPLQASGREGDLATVEVEVRQGDTLGGIARRHGVSVDDVRRWNRKRVGAGDMIRAGTTLVLKVPAGAPPSGSARPKESEPTRAKPTPDAKPSPDAKPAKKAPPALAVDEDDRWYATYLVRPGDTISRIARKLEVEPEDLLRWNSLKKAHHLRAGQTLRYAGDGPRPPARSRGRTTSGSLENAIHLGEGPGYRLRFPRNAYGLPSVARTLKRCTARMPRRFKGTADILIGDLSRPHGGRFPPHVSHQSGRDVDIGYYLRGNVQNETMYRVRADQVDYEKSWELLACLLSEDEVVRVYIDAPIQVAMAEYLRKTRRLSERQVDRLFGAVGEIQKDALIHHAPKHDTHIHVRFGCDADQPDCAEDPGDRPFEL